MKEKKEPEVSVTHSLPVPCFSSVGFSFKKCDKKFPGIRSKSNAISIQSCLLNLTCFDSSPVSSPSFLACLLACFALTRLQALKSILSRVYCVASVSVSSSCASWKEKAGRHQEKYRESTGNIERKVLSLFLLSCYSRQSNVEIVSRVQSSWMPSMT